MQRVSVVWAHCSWDNAGIVFSPCTEGNILPFSWQHEHADAALGWATGGESARAPHGARQAFVVPYGSARN